jgi:hypothetical protein
LGVICCGVRTSTCRRPGELAALRTGVPALLDGRLIAIVGSLVDYCFAGLKYHGTEATMIRKITPNTRSASFNPFSLAASSMVDSMDY